MTMKLSKEQIVKIAQNITFDFDGNVIINQHSKFLHAVGDYLIPAIAEHYPDRLMAVQMRDLAISVVKDVKAEYNSGNMEDKLRAVSITTQRLFTLFGGFPYVIPTFKFARVA